MNTRSSTKRHIPKDDEYGDVNMPKEDFYSWLLSITSIMEKSKEFRSLVNYKPKDIDKERELIQILDLTLEQHLELQSIMDEREIILQQLELSIKQKACILMKQIIEKVREHEDVISPGMMEILDLNKLFEVVEADLKRKKLKTSH